VTILEALENAADSLEGLQHTSDESIIPREVYDDLKLAISRLKRISPNALGVTL